MTVGFMLNGKEHSVEVKPNERLIDVLRGSFNLKGAKLGCSSGQCGACAVFFNYVITPACLVPAFRMRNSVIMTIEGFSQTSEYTDIVNCFESAGVENCGYCDSGKILIAESLIGKNNPLNKEAVILAYDSVKCRCTDIERLVKGVFAAAELRRGRGRNAAGGA